MNQSAVYNPKLSSKNSVIAAHLSEKNNKIELVKEMIFEIVDKHNSNVGVIDQDLGLKWIST